MYFLNTIKLRAYHNAMLFHQVTHFEKLRTSDPHDLIDISRVTGEVINKAILDFERGQEVVFQVRAHAAGFPGQEARTSDAKVTIKLQDVNDNAPVFQQRTYEKRIPETLLPTVRLGGNTDDIQNIEFSHSIIILLQYVYWYISILVQGSECDGY